jgi:hypothetical protein
MRSRSSFVPGNGRFDPDGFISQIDPRLYAGPQPVSGPTREGVRWEWLDGLVDSVVSLIHSDYSPLPCVTVRAFPFNDMIDPARCGISLAMLGEIVTHLQCELDAGRRVYVHCQAGQSRTGLVLTAHRVRAKSEHWRVALAELQKRRPCLNPNTYFEQLLDVW